jgi:riboflavin kinase / FMN adenylyltransferase
VDPPFVNIPLAPGFRLHKGLTGIPDDLKGGTVAIGNFDGVHLGHKAVLAAARQAAGPGPVLAMTFEPHPRTFFRPEVPLPRLTPAREKRLLLSHEALDGMVELTFDAELAALSAEDFVSDVLVKRLEVETAVVGWDFHFGRGRGGSPAFLAEAGPRHGFTAIVIPPFGGENPVSSSRIRENLAAGDVSEANHMLGHRWFVMGEVVHGEKVGRTLGYPTANLVLPPETPLAQGIYAVRATFDGTIRDGVASFGRRPQFHEDAPPLLETYVFDFKGDLYGKTLGIEFVSFLRSEQKFAGVEDLISQMHRDAIAARRVLSGPVDPAAPSAIG